MSTRNHYDATGKQLRARKAEPDRAVALPSDGGRAPRVRSNELLNNGEQLIIEHAGREYCLRVTSNGKLILTA
ncbi:MAG: hemin uptake protein HemP [Sulfuricaulis sp.]|uniref:hemin uptake protein HemP n=1 Tax=Sulfuricaulis sp. TaxID=2003553 RepID=UPI0025DF89F9|nr:hemin uptake protein HemP [Sulfuricaulis sp.]MCR4346346.1 hemin uptake protein HemP [Sulfuricaulis sp.]